MQDKEEERRVKNKEVEDQDQKNQLQINIGKCCIKQNDKEYKYGRMKLGMCRIKGEGQRFQAQRSKPRHKRRRRLG